jgi:hypothetical protein
MIVSCRSYVTRQVRLSLPLLVLWLAATWLVPSAALAQISRVGNSLGLFGFPGGAAVLNVDVAYDPAHGVYFIVAGGGPMQGVFADTSGAVVAGTQPFQVGPAQGGGNGIYAAHPRAIYSSELNNGQGGFLVTWIQATGGPSYVHSIVVSYPGGVVGSDQTVSDSRNYGALYEAAAAIAYSTTSHKFLVAWQTGDGGHIQGRFLDSNGTVSAGIMEFEPGCSRDPGVAWNSATDEFGVSVSGYCNGAYAGLRRVAASTGAQSGLTTFGYSGGTFVSDVVVNPANHHYLVGWASSAGGNIAELDQSGNFIRATFQGLGTYDGFAIAFNALGGTILAVGQGNSAEILGLEADATGVPLSSAAALTNGGGVSGSYAPRVTERSGTKQWNIAYSRQHTTATDQIIQTAASGGGGGGGGGGSSIQMAIESPTNGQLLSSSTPFTLTGYAADTGASSGTGIDSVHVYVTPSGGSATFLTAVTSFTTSTTGGLLGTQFVNSGFSIPIGGLPAGSYTISVFAHSTVLNGFSPVPRTVAVTLTGSLPLMSLDTPQNNAAIASNTFNVTGWAINKFAASGSGIDGVQVWAFPAGGGSPIFAGAATLGIPRPDIGAIFGAQFGGAGFTLTTTLPSGTYTVRAFVHVAATNNYDLSQAAVVTVGPASDPVMNVETPGNGAVKSHTGFTIGGWAIDRGATSNTGVDAVHIWAFPASGGPAIFVGAATPGARPDVQAAYGANFLNSGFTLTAVLPADTYTIGVFALSNIAGYFNQVKWVSGVIVQ